MKSPSGKLDVLASPVSYKTFAATQDHIAEQQVKKIEKNNK
ncbi:hypothetical protein ACFWDG_20250 [Peribacillus sp. NPDC060186]